MEPSIREATPGDAAPLARFAERNFRETYASFNSAEDMEDYVARSFTPTGIERELRDPSVVFLVAEHRDGICGYAHLRIGASPHEPRVPHGAELARLYAAREWHGRGLARRILDACLEVAARRGCTTLWLGVWERNERARAFYAKHGFSEVGVQEFLLGSDRQRDLVLIKPLPEEVTG